MDYVSDPYISFARYHQYLLVVMGTYLKISGKWKWKFEEKIFLLKTLKYSKESFVSPTNIKNGMTSIPVGH